jgi:spore germination protein YaaH
MRPRRRPLPSIRSRRWVGPVAVAAVVAVIGGVLLLQPRIGGQLGPGAASQAAGPGAGSAGSAVPTAVPIPGHEVYGFIPYWEMDATLPDHVAGTDLTTIGLFSVTHATNGSLRTNQTGYKRITGDVGQQLIRAARDHGTKVEIVYSSFGASKNRTFYGRPAAQARWIKELVAFVADQKLDGINVDVEALPSSLVPAYGAFVGRLREALLARLPTAQLSVATQANEVGAAMAAAASAAGADRIFLMGYDYRVAASQPGAAAPIARADGGTKNLVWSLDLYASLGVPVERTLLGLPLYGYTWPVVGPLIGAPSVHRGSIWVPRQNLRVFQAPSFAPTYDPTESVEFYAVSDPTATPDPSGVGGSWNAVYYDSPRSLAPKLALADARGLAGAGFWAIGYERGLPGYTDLIKTFHAGKLEAAAAP